MNKKIINPFYLKCVWLTSRSFQRVRLSNTTYIIHIYIYIYPRWTPSTFRFQNLDNFLMLWAHAHNSQQMNLCKNRINTDIIYLFCVRLICPLRLYWITNRKQNYIHFWVYYWCTRNFIEKSLLWSLTSALFFSLHHNKLRSLPHLTTKLTTDKTKNRIPNQITNHKQSKT